MIIHLNFAKTTLKTEKKTEIMNNKAKAKLKAQIKICYKAFANNFHLLVGYY